MSASLDPAKAARFSEKFILEIVSKKAAPVVNVSAWDVAEREMILPRNQKYEIVRILNKVDFENSRGTNKLVVIQMMEI